MTILDNKQARDHAPLRLASRASPLALAQTEQVRRLLAPRRSEIIRLTTQGDEVLDRPLVEIGGKGVFIKTLEAALLDGRADAAVHSAKDLEAETAPGTYIAAFLAREDARDALVGPFSSLDELPEGAHIGTASVRRTAILKNVRPDLQVSLLRGNVNSRLKRLDDGEFDAIILAVAGLKRLGLDVPYSPLSSEIMPPSAAQGALAIQLPDTADNELADAVAGLGCPQTTSCVTAERAALAKLDGSCQTPLSAHAVLTDTSGLVLRLVVLSPDGRQRFETSLTGQSHQAEMLGHTAAEQLLEACGGRSFLA